MKKSKYLPINWTNGTKLTSEHFIHSHLYEVERASQIQAFSLTGFNFGLGKPEPSEEEAIYYRLSGTTPNSAVIELLSCEGITPSGYRISYDSQLYGAHSVRSQEQNFEEAEDGDLFYVLVSVAPFKRIPVGRPDPEVVPLHHPYALPEVKVHLVKQEALNSGVDDVDYLIVGRYLLSNGVLKSEEDYIPPIQRLGYSKKAEVFLQGVVKSLERLYSYSQQMYRKNVSNLHRIPLADSSLKLCSAFQDFYTEHNFAIRHLLQEESPCKLVEKGNILGQKLICALTRLSENDYEHLLQYYYTWTDCTPAEIEQELGQLAGVSYSHLDMAKSFRVLQRTLNMLERIFARMSELEYIGVVRENIIISEEEDAPRNKQRSIWRILD